MAADSEDEEHTVSGAFVFREGPSGELEFVGDFDGLYGAESDPWGQSGSDPRLGRYYDRSRATIIDMLRPLAPLDSVLEVGCGLGQVCAEIRESGCTTVVHGVDSSRLAVEKARGRFADIRFFVGDIRDPAFAAPRARYGAVVVNQTLWYILDGLPQALDNVHRLLGPGGHLLIANAFMRTPQRYGREIVDGFDGLVRYLANHTDGTFTFREARLHSDADLLYDDGHVLMRSV